MHRYVEFDINEETYYCDAETPANLIDWLSKEVGDVPTIDVKRSSEISSFPDEVVRLAVKHIKEFLAIAEEIIYQSRLKKLVPFSNCLHYFTA